MVFFFKKRLFVFLPNRSEKSGCMTAAPIDRSGPAKSFVVPLLVTFENDRFWERKRMKGISARKPVPVWYWEGQMMMLAGRDGWKLFNLAEARHKTMIYQNERTAYCTVHCNIHRSTSDSFNSSPSFSATSNTAFSASLRHHAFPAGKGPSRPLVSGNLLPSWALQPRP